MKKTLKFIKEHKGAILVGIGALVLILDLSGQNAYRFVLGVLLIVEGVSAK